MNSFQPRINFVVGVWRVQHELQVGAKSRTQGTTDTRRDGLQ